MVVEYRQVVDYPAYRVSSFGLVKSVDRMVRGNMSLNFRHGKRMKQSSSNGYKYVSLTKDGKTKRIQVHRVVAKAFIDNKNDKPQVNHKDCNKSNNKVSNLEWSTREENMQHAADNGLLNLKTGASSHHAKLSKKDVLKIKKLYSTSKYSQKDIADNYNVTQSCISKITRGAKWKHLL